MNITKKILNKVFGYNLHPLFIVSAEETFLNYAQDFNIKRDIDYIRFLAQAKHEIQFILKDWKRYPRLEENLNFSDRTLYRYSSYWRANKEELKELRKQPLSEQYRVIFNKWYNGRMGNRVDTNDGRTFVGHGSLMITGRANTIKCLKHIEEKTNIVCFDVDGKVNHSLFQRLDIFWLLGFAYWNLNGLHKCRGTDCVTNKVNKGLPKKDKDRRLKTAIYLKKELLSTTKLI